MDEAAKQIVKQLVIELRKSHKSSDKAYRGMLFSFRKAWDDIEAAEKLTIPPIEPGDVE